MKKDDFLASVLSPVQLKQLDFVRGALLKDPTSLDNREGNVKFTPVQEAPVGTEAVGES